MVICSRDQTNGVQIDHYYNSAYSTPQYLNANTKVGIGSYQTLLLGDDFICTYQRQNSNNAANYYDLNANPTAYVIAAHGPTTTTGG